MTPTSACHSSSSTQTITHQSLWPPPLRAVRVVRRDDRASIVVHHGRAGPHARGCPAGSPRAASRGRSAVRSSIAGPVSVIAAATCDMSTCWPCPVALRCCSAVSDDDHAVHAAGVVHVRPAPAGGRLARQPRGVREARERLHRGPIVWYSCLRPDVPEAGHRDVDDVGLDRLASPRSRGPSSPCTRALKFSITTSDMPTSFE